jgi:hypothetical protein
MVHTNIPSMVLMYQDEYTQGTTMKAWEKLTMDGDRVDQIDLVLFLMIPHI